MWIEMAKGALAVLGGFLVAWAGCRLANAGGASQWASPDAPRHADGTPDYPAIGRAILADEDEDEGPSFCPACLACAREMGETQEPIGEPDLCQKHMERLIGWTSIEPHSMGRIVGGMLNYAARTTEAGRRE